VIVNGLKPDAGFLILDNGKLQSASGHQKTSGQSIRKTEYQEKRTTDLCLVADILFAVTLPSDTLIVWSAYVCVLVICISIF